MSARNDMENDDDVITSCKEKLSEFRIKELKYVLSRVGLSKQGKKQDLVDRILAMLYDEGTPGLFKNNVNGKEGLVEIIDETHRNMQEPVSNESAPRKPNSSGSSRLRPKLEVEESNQLERKIRCPCGKDLLDGTSLVQCIDPDCNVWQHTNCVIIPEKPMEKTYMPTQFFCEICRVKRADPFWATMAYPLYPVKLVALSIPVDGTNPHVSAEKIFRLTRADRDLLQKTEYDVQVWCMLFNDVVPFRIQWPQYADIQVNGVPLRAVSRPGSQQLGANGRDDGARIKTCIVEGVNKVSISFTDARTFCFGVRLVRRRTLEQVFGMIPKEPDGELFEDALARVQRCIGGGIATGNDDSDSDLEVIADSVTVSLRCPMSGSRMKTAGRFRACAHMGCFDLDTFVGINERTRKWQCPICLKNYCLEDVVVDPFFNRVLNMMKSCGEEINEIDMKPNGSWRVRKARDAGNLAKWHSPDGAAEVSSSENGQESVLECNTSPQGMLDSQIDQGNNEAGNHDLNIITMSSTTTGNGKDDGDPSINQGGVEDYVVSNGNEPEVSSGYNRFGQTQGTNDQCFGLPNEQADIIILSDSEDDDVSLISPASAAVDSPTDPEGHSASALMKNSPGSGADRMMSESALPSNLQLDSGFELFGTSGALIDEHNSATCSKPSETTINAVPHVMDAYEPLSGSSHDHLTSVNGNILLEVRDPCPSVSGNSLPLLNNHLGEACISRQTRGNGCGSSSGNDEAHQEPGNENLLDPQNQFRSKEDDLIQDTQGDSGLRSGSGPEFAVKRKRSDGPFSFPRQKRSPRRLVYQARSSHLSSR